jgi:hypothetical protein
MKMRLLCTSGGVSLSPGDFADWADVFGSISLKFASGVLIEFETHLFRRLFVISDPIEINKDSGIKATLIGMDSFEVSNPPKSVVIAELSRHLADVEIKSRDFSMADVKLTICDKLNQPHYTIEKYNVPYKGFMTDDFNVRGELIAAKIFHKIQHMTVVK